MEPSYLYLITSVEGTSFENHLLLVQDKETKLYGYCDSEGYCAIIPQFEDANSFQNSYAPISQSGKWSHIDLNGNVCSPAVFDSPYYFESERAIAMKNGSPVLIDASGDTLKILDSELTYYDFLPEGIALFSSRFYTGLIDIEEMNYFHCQKECTLILIQLMVTSFPRESTLL